ncbi:type III-A CRISPR-associated protein Csm2 [Sulfurihydrogenibium sp.]|jgi:CRISPR-associated protein Csm2|uniref:type III-A CRISPR-associated protein Csm2 n=1 Tax=Sulfurihydrogenibium sp. TaxID=2053621 RepID=UPI002605ED43|nr:type III-A CRISPR-associated protein Csm2 [Sulfurihydrogenibium sp.]
MADVKSGLDVSKELKEILYVKEDGKERKVEKKDCKAQKNQINQHYENLIKKVNQDIKNGILNIDLEAYLQPEGVCEVIAYAVGCRGKLKRSQLRKFFNEIKTIEYDLKSGEDVKKIQIRILALIPKLAYSKGRELIDEEFYEFMKAILMKVKEDMNKENPQEVFEVFVKILESIVAYHTYHFPKEA